MALVDRFNGSYGSYCCLAHIAPMDPMSHMLPTIGIAPMTPNAIMAPRVPMAPAACVFDGQR